jgi:hypothetical protein
VRSIQINDKDEVVYIEKEYGGNNQTYEPIPFRNLVSGHKSIIAMIGDMLTRFFHIQP